MTLFSVENSNLLLMPYGDWGIRIVLLTERQVLIRSQSYRFSNIVPIV